MRSVPASFRHGAPSGGQAADSTGALSAALLTAPALGAPAVEPLTAFSNAQWTAKADSQETSAACNPASAAIDSNAATFWHTAYSGAAPAPLPHSIMIDTKTLTTISGLTYLPRQDGSAKGRIGQFTLEPGRPWRRAPLPTKPTSSRWTLSARQLTTCG